MYLNLITGGGFHPRYDNLNPAQLGSTKRRKVQISSLTTGNNKIFSDIRTCKQESNITVILIDFDYLFYETFHFNSNV